MQLRKWVVLALGSGLFGAFALVLVDRALSLPRSFDAERWRNSDARERDRMAGDLNRSGAILGKTRAEVVALLGPADRESDWGLEYELISSFGFGYAEFRKIFEVHLDGGRFDVNGRVRKVTFFD